MSGRRRGRQKIAVIHPLPLPPLHSPFTRSNSLPHDSSCSPHALLRGGGRRPADLRAVRRHRHKSAHAGYRREHARWWLKSFPSDALVLCEEEWDRAAPTSAMFGEREREASLEMVNTDPIITSTQTPGGCLSQYPTLSLLTQMLPPHCRLWYQGLGNVRASNIETCCTACSRCGIECPCWETPGLSSSTIPARPPPQPLYPARNNPTLASCPYTNPRA